MCLVLPVQGQLLPELGDLALGLCALSKGGPGNGALPLLELGSLLRDPRKVGLG